MKSFKSIRSPKVAVTEAKKQKYKLRSRDTGKTAEKLLTSKEAEKLRDQGVDATLLEKMSDHDYVTDIVWDVKTKIDPDKDWNKFKKEVIKRASKMLIKTDGYEIADILSESVTEGQVDVNWASDHLPAVEAGKKMNVKVNKISGKQKLRMKGKGKDIKKLLLSLGWTTSDLKRVVTSVTEAKADIKFTPAEYKLIENFAQKNLSVDGYVHVEGESIIVISNEVGEGRDAVRNSTYVKKVGPGTSNGFHHYVVSTGSELVSRSRWPLAPKNKKAVAFSEPFEGTSDLKELNRVLTKAVK